MTGQTLSVRMNNGFAFNINNEHVYCSPHHFVYVIVETFARPNIINPSNSPFHVLDARHDEKMRKICLLNEMVSLKWSIKIAVTQSIISHEIHQILSPFSRHRKELSEKEREKEKRLNFNYYVLNDMCFGEVHNL